MQTLTVDNLPPHTHTISADGAHRHGIFTTRWGEKKAGDGEPYIKREHIARDIHWHLKTDEQGAHNHGGKTGSTGKGLSFDNRPEFFKLAFIMKL